MAKILLAGFMVLSLTGCYYDSKEYLFPQVKACDTTAVTYSGSVQPIIEQYCYRCHSNANAPIFGGNIRLEDYSEVVIPANNGHLYGSINHENGYIPMPQDGSKLDNCSVTTIKVWIDAGSPDN